MIGLISTKVTRELKREFDNVTYYEHDLVSVLEEIISQTSSSFVFIIDERYCVFRDNRINKDSQYDLDHIIFNRFRCNTYYLNKDGKVSIIPGRGLLCQPNIKYNDRAFALEEYFIKKYNPWVIDLSKYFMGDQNDWDNLNGAHFEREFYRETFDQIKRIIFGETDKRVYDEPDFFNPDRRGYEEDMKRKFNVEYNLEILDVLMNNNDILWLNILDKLNSYAPDDSRVVELVAWMNQNNHE